MLATVAVVLATERPSGGGQAGPRANPGAPAGTPRRTTPAPSASLTTLPTPSASARQPTDDPPPTAGNDDLVPQGFFSWHDPMGFSIALPDGWTRVGDNGFASGSRFAAPGDPRVLLVDVTTTPGPDPVAAWRDLEPTVRAQARDYRRIGSIRRVQYRGWKTADWEWTFVFRGIRYRTLDRGFVNSGYGYAVKWSVPADAWDSTANRRALDVFLRSFQPRS